VLVLVLLGGGIARAQEPARPGEAAAGSKHVISEATPTAEETDAPPEAKKLWDNIVCSCGDCKRMSIGSCTCSFAAEERARIVAMITEQGMTPEQVTQAFVRQYGTGVLLVPADNAFNRLAWLIPYVAFGLALAIIFILARRWVRRPAPLATAGPAAAAPPREPDELDEKLDEQLRDID
jgi:cytochrome c-type biogenesis protein CcmH/NrfF